MRSPASLLLIAAALAGCTATTIDLTAVAPDYELVVTPDRTPTRVQIINQGPGSVLLSLEGGEPPSEWTDTLAPGAMDVGIGAGRSLVIRAEDSDGGEAPLIRVVVNAEGCTISRRALPRSK